MMNYNLKWLLNYHNDDHQNLATQQLLDYTNKLYFESNWQQYDQVIGFQLKQG
jgi:hypothetical protein